MLVTPDCLSALCPRLVHLLVCSSLTLWVGCDGDASNADDATVADVAVADGAVGSADGMVDATSAPDAELPDAAPPEPDAAPPPLPIGGEECRNFRCAPGLECFYFFALDVHLCTEFCLAPEACPAEYGANPCCTVPGPQLLDSYCAPRDAYPERDCAHF